MIISRDGIRTGWASPKFVCGKNEGQKIIVNCFQLNSLVILAKQKLKKDYQRKRKIMFFSGSGSIGED